MIHSNGRSRRNSLWIGRLEPRQFLSSTLVISGTAAADTITLAASPSGDIPVTFNGKQTDYPVASYSAVQVNSGGGSDVVTVQATLRSTTLSSTGPASVTIGNTTDGMDDIGAPISVTNSGGSTALTLNDFYAPAAKTVTVDAAADGSGLVQGLAPADVRFAPTGTGSLVLKLFDFRGNVVNVHQAVVPTQIFSEPRGSFGPATGDVIDVGRAGSMAGIASPLTVVGRDASTVVDDSADVVARHVILDKTPAAAVTVQGISPAVITAPGVRVNLPSVGGNAVDVLACPGFVRLISGAAGDSPHDRIHIGNGGTLATLTKALSVESSTGLVDVTVDDSADTAAQAVSVQQPPPSTGGPPRIEISLSAAQPQMIDVASPGGSITFLAGPVASSFSVVDLTPFARGTVTFDAGAAGGTAVIGSTPAGSTVNLVGGGGALTVQFELYDATRMMAGVLNVSNDTGSISLTADEPYDGLSRHVVLGSEPPGGSPGTWSSIDGVLAGRIRYHAAALGQQLSLSLRNAGDDLAILGTPPASQIKITGFFVLPVSVDFAQIGNGTGVTFNGFGNRVMVRGSGSADVINMSPSGRITRGTDLLTFGNTLTSLTIEDGTFNELPETADLTVTGADTLLDLATAPDPGRLHIDGGRVVVRVSPGQVFNSLNLNNGLEIDNGGVLDLTACQLTATFPAGADGLATIRSYLASGYNGGAWNGPGIISSSLDAAHALAYTLTPYPNVVLVRAALVGDALIHSAVDFSNLLWLAQHYNQMNATWHDGDLNYDGIVGFADLLRLAQNYGRTGRTRRTRLP